MQNLKVHRINNDEVDWSPDIHKKKVVKIPSGLTVFFIRHYQQKNPEPVPVIANLKKGNTYFLGFSIASMSPLSIRYKVTLYNNEIEGEDITIRDINVLRDLLK